MLDNWWILANPLLTVRTIHHKRGDRFCGGVGCALVFLLRTTQQYEYSSILVLGVLALYHTAVQMRPNTVNIQER